MNWVAIWWLTVAVANPDFERIRVFYVCLGVLMVTTLAVADKLIQREKRENPLSASTGGLTRVLAVYFVVVWAFPVILLMV